VDLEIIERLAIGIALAQDRIPGQARLRPFQNKEFKQPAVVVQRHAPLFVVVADRKFIFWPLAAFHHRSIL
jgi:hypothetical protein